MRELIENDVRDRICGLFGGVQGDPPRPGAAKFVVQFDSRNRRAKQPSDGRHSVTFNDATSLVELCVQARYRGRAWASAWVRAVYMHGAEILAYLELARKFREFPTRNLGERIDKSIRMRSVDLSGSTGGPA